MIKNQDKSEIRIKRHKRLRFNLKGTAARPRLSVYRSTANMYVQIIDDEKGVTLVSAGTLGKSVDTAGKSKTEQAQAVGKAIAEKALAAGITEVVFDRGGYLYTGRVKALADAARDAGLKF